MVLLIVSFVAWVLTVLAPCVLPLLPIILGSWVTSVQHNRWAPYIIIGSLSVSILLFTLLLKATTLFIEIPTAFRWYFSWTIIIIIWIFFLFPAVRQGIMHRIGVQEKSHALMARASSKTWAWKHIWVWFALWPVFSSCSPTYFFVLGTVLPASFALGMINLVAYIMWLAIILLLIAWLGQTFTQKLKWLANPQWWGPIIIGIIFIIVGVTILTGYDKIIEAHLLSRTFYEQLINFEYSLLDTATDR